MANNQIKVAACQLLTSEDVSDGVQVLIIFLTSWSHMSWSLPLLLLSLPSVNRGPDI